MEASIKSKILNYLQQNRGWQYGGVIEDYIRLTDGHKASNASRRCRELEDEGKIESQYVKVPGVSNKVVQYRYVGDSSSGKTADSKPENRGSIPLSPAKVQHFDNNGNKKCCVWGGNGGLHSSNCYKNKELAKQQATIF